MVRNVSVREAVGGYLKLLQLFILSCTAVSLNPCVHETMDMHTCAQSPPPDFCPSSFQPSFPSLFSFSSFTGDSATLLEGRKWLDAN